MRTSSRKTWDALQKLSLSYFIELKSQHKAWTLNQLLEKLDIPRTALFCRLAEQAGFAENGTPSPEQVCAVAGLCMKGVWSIETIAQELSLPVQIVKEVFRKCAAGFGQAPYGVSPYSGSKKFSDGKETVPRRVTTAGQLSYRGCLYTLGASFRGRRALIKERGEQLLVMFQDRPPLYLTRRKTKARGINN